MNILQITKYYYPYIGGIEQTAKDISISIPSEHTQKVICFNEGNETIRDNLDGVEVVRCGIVGVFASQPLSIKYGKVLRKLVKEFEPDIIIFHYPNPYAAHYLLKILKKYPKCKLFVWWHLDIMKQKVLGKFFHSQSIRLLKRAKKIIATSPNYVEGSKYLSQYREKCIILPSCINENRLQVTSEILKKTEEIKRNALNKTICFSFGRHVPYKGLEYLLSATEQLDENFTFFIGGKGPLTSKLMEKAKDNSKVVFLGRISDEQMIAYLLACDIFCFPSITKNEAFGLALAEAMYFSKPVVTFHIDGSGVNFVSRNGITGIECENRNVDALANAIQTLSQDPQLRVFYGQKARERVLDNFTFEKFQLKIKALLKSEMKNAE